MKVITDIDPARPVLIAGPTASGKSALAMAIARAQGGVIVNADALQVYENWHSLSARPSVADEIAVPHRLYGHVGPRQEYSTGHWLREVRTLLDGPDRLIITGGTGLYFTALTEGLAETPMTPPATRARIDTQNPMRVQRAWEVQQATGQGLAAWQDATPPPLLPREACTPILVEAGKDWLNARIARRFERMLEAGALDEVRANLAIWDPALPSMKAIGAPDLVAYLRGEITLGAARDGATIATRQYAKRQRTWFRARMRNWRRIAAETL